MQAVYKDGDKIIAQVRTGIPGYKNFKDFEFGFKIRDRTQPENWYLDDGVVALPAKSALPKGPLQSMKSSFGALVQSIRGKNLGPTDTEA